MEVFTEQTAPASQRRRAVREDVRRSRDAMKILRPLYHDLNTWQVQVARLISDAERQRDHNEHDATSRQKAAALKRTILAARRALAERLDTVPEDIRTDGRVIDVRRAIESALAGLSEAQRLLS